MELSLRTNWSRSSEVEIFFFYGIRGVVVEGETYCAVPSHLPLDGKRAPIDLSEQLQLNVSARDLRRLSGSFPLCDVIAGVRDVEFDDAVLLQRTVYQRLRAS